MKTLTFFCFGFFAFAQTRWVPQVGPRDMMRMVNPHTFPLSVQLSFLDETGAIASQSGLSLQPSESILLSLDVWIQGTEKYQLKLDSPGKVGVQILSIESDNMLEKPSLLLSQGPFLIPHIAEDTQKWFSHVQVCTESGVAPFSLKVANQKKALPLKGHRALVEADLEQALGTDFEPGSGWGILDPNGSYAAGYLSFGTESGSQKAHLPLNFERSSVLILPHIPKDKVNWWTGLVLINPAGVETVASIEFMSEMGLVETREITLDPRSKRVFLLSDLWGGAIPDAVEWALIRSEKQISGFELFGTTNDLALAGLPLSHQFYQEALIMWPANPAWWSGLVLLNPSNLATTVTLEVVGSDGVVTGSKLVEMPASGKKTILLDNEFGLGEYWLRLKSNRGVAAFQLVGNAARTQLAAFPVESFEISSLAGGMPNPWFPTQENLNLERVAWMDSNHNGFLEWVAHDGSQVGVAEWLPAGNQTKTYLFEELNFEIAEDTEVYPFSFDLDQNGSPELILNTDEMWIFYTGDGEGLPEFTPFQPLRPNVTEDPIIRDVLDLDLDGWLDILTNRNLFRSYPTFDNHYNVNNFPSYFSVSGKGSLFLELNDDVYPDILTALFDSHYGLIQNQVFEETPIYTPQTPKDIIEMHRFDFNSDGNPDVLSLLADSGLSTTASHYDMSRIRWQSVENLGQGELTFEEGFGQLRLLNPEGQGTANFEQAYGSTSRFISWDQNGPKIDHAWGKGQLVDVNGDGFLDWLSAAGLALREPTGVAYQPALNLSLDRFTDDTFHTRFADFDGDFEVECLELRRKGTLLTTVTLYEPDRHWSRWVPSIQFDIEVGVIGYFDLRDMDGDGDLDLAICGSGLLWYEQKDGAWDRFAKIYHNASIFALGAVIEGDFNQNGEIDLLGYKSGKGNQVHIFYDVFSAQPETRPLDLNADISFFEVIDFNRDGWPDFTMQDPRRGQFIFLNKQKLGDFQYVEVPFGLSIYTQADYNGDGVLDVFGLTPFTTNNENRQYLRMATGKPQGGFDSFFVFLLPSDTFYKDLVSTDINRDGRPDLIGLGTSDRTENAWLDVWINQVVPGIERIPMERVYRLACPPYVDMSLQDLNGDGIKDLRFFEEFNFIWNISQVSLHRLEWQNNHPFPIPSEE